MYVPLQEYFFKLGKAEWNSRLLCPPVEGGLLKYSKRMDWGLTEILMNFAEKLGLYHQDYCKSYDVEQR